MVALLHWLVKRKLLRIAQEDRKYSLAISFRHQFFEIRHLFLIRLILVVPLLEEKVRGSPSEFCVTVIGMGGWKNFMARSIR